MKLAPLVALVGFAITLTSLQAQNPFAGRYSGPVFTSVFGQEIQAGQMSLDINNAGEIISLPGVAFIANGTVSNGGAVSLLENLFGLASGKIVDNVLTVSGTRSLPGLGSQTTRMRLVREGDTGGNGAVLPDPGPIGLVSYRDRIGDTLQFTTTGSTLAPIVGTDVYTDNSPLAVTAVHAGVLRNGETGEVSVRMLAGRNNYTGSTRNGVFSIDWTTDWPASYEFVTDGGGDPSEADFTITTQPSSTQVDLGDSVELTVVAAGEGLSYQWYGGESGDTRFPIANATMATLRLDAVNESANYWVEVRNASGTRASDTVDVLLNLPEGAVTQVTVSAKASGAFGNPSSSSTAMVEAFQFTGGDQLIGINASGEASFGEGLLGGPDGLTVARSVIAGFTPLEEAAIAGGDLEANALPGEAFQVGALIGAFVPAAQASAAGFQANKNAGLPLEALFFVGSGPFAFVSPEAGTLFLGINEAWMQNNSGDFNVSITAIPTEAPVPGEGNDLSVSSSPGGLVLSWAGEGALQQSSDLRTWSDVAGAASPYTATDSGQGFFRLRE